MITDQTQLGLLQGTIRRESWESTRKCQTDLGFYCRTQGEGTTLSTLLCLTARWIYADCDSEVIFRLDVVIKLGWIGWGWESKVLCVVQKKEWKKENLRKSDCEDNGSKKKRTIVLRQQGENQWCAGWEWLKQGWKSQTDSKWEVGTGEWQGRGCFEENQWERRWKQAWKKERKKQNREDNKGEKKWKKWNETK